MYLESFILMKNVQNVCHHHFILSTATSRSSVRCTLTLVVIKKNADNSHIGVLDPKKIHILTAVIGYKTNIYIQSIISKAEKDTIED